MRIARKKNQRGANTREVHRSSIADPEIFHSRARYMRVERSLDLRQDLIGSPSGVENTPCGLKRIISARYK
jgi:hypothetical protein